MGDEEWLNQFENRLHREPTPEEREQEAQDERLQRLIRRIDDMELRLQGRLGFLLQEIDKRLDQRFEDTTRRTKDIYDLVCGVGGLVLFLVVRPLASEYSPWLWLLWPVGYFAWRWRRQGLGFAALAIYYANIGQWGGGQCN